MKRLQCKTFSELPENLIPHGFKMVDTQPYIIRVMEEMGLAEGGFIPIANEENKQLLEQINRLSAGRTDSAGKVQISDQRLGNLKVHLKS